TPVSLKRTEVPEPNSLKGLPPISQLGAGDLSRPLIGKVTLQRSQAPAPRSLRVGTLLIILLPAILVGLLVEKWTHPSSAAALQLAHLQPVSLAAGEMGKLRIIVNRGKKLSGPVELGFDGAPQGIIIAHGEVPDDKSDLDVDVMALPDLEPGDYRIQLTASLD